MRLTNIVRGMRLQMPSGAVYQTVHRLPCMAWLCKREGLDEEAELSAAFLRRHCRQLPTHSPGGLVAA